MRWTLLSVALHLLRHEPGCAAAIVSLSARLLLCSTGRCGSFQAAPTVSKTMIAWYVIQRYVSLWDLAASASAQSEGHLTRVTASSRAPKIFHRIFSSKSSVLAL